MVGTFHSTNIAPLAFALKNRLPALFKALIDDGHDPCEEEETLLNAKCGYLFELAIRHNETLAIEILLEDRIYVQKTSHRLEDFLDLALISERSEIISLLVNHGGRVMTFTPLIRAPPLAFLLGLPEIEHEMTQETGGDQVMGTTIHSAIFQGKIHLLELLVSNGANTNAPCYIKRGQEQTIAFVPSGLWSLVGEQTRILDFLLENGAQANFFDNPLIMPPLISHTSGLRVQAARKLLEHGADVHYDGRYGTPLYHAAHLFDKRLGRILRAAGAQDVTTVSYWVGL